MEDLKQPTYKIIKHININAVVTAVNELLQDDHWQCLGGLQSYVSGGAINWYQTMLFTP